MVTEEVVSTETGNTPTPHQLDYSGNRNTQYSQTHIKRSLFGQFFLDKSSLLRQVTS